MAEPLSLTTGIITLITLAIKLVVGAAGLIDKTVTAQREAVNELRDLQQDLERLKRRMDQIHDILRLLSTNTKDRAFKKLLQDPYGSMAIRELCSALDETFAVLERLTDCAESEKTNIQSIALPANDTSLAYVQAVLKHNFSPSKIADLVDNLKSIQFEIRACFDKLQSSFNHVNDVYNIIKNPLVRVAATPSIVSTSTTLTARIKLVGWLKRRKGTWGLSSRGRSTTLCDFLDSDRIFRLPSNLLNKVLRHLCSDGPLPLRHVLFVSKEFYHAAVNNTFLWTTISFDDEFYSHFRGRSVKQANSFTKQCLLRSASLPLCLYIHGPDVDDGNILFNTLQIFKNPKYRGFERCTSLVWSNLLASTTQEIMALLPKELPSLQYMSFSRYYFPANRSQFPNCPVLEDVKIYNSWGYCPPFWETNFSHVTTFSFGTTHFWTAERIATLSQFHWLHDLTLFTLGQGCAPYSTSARPPTVFHYLRILRVHGDVPPIVFTEFLVIGLEELHIKANSDGKTSITALWSSFDSCFRNLYASLPEAISSQEQEPEWATNLSKLAEKCTGLEALYISKWMEEECKNFVDGYNVVLYVL